MYFASFFSGVKKLLEAKWLLADQRCGWIQDGVILHSDPGLLQHPVFLIHSQSRGQQANSSIPEERHADLTVYALHRLCKSKFVFSPACLQTSEHEILSWLSNHITPLNQCFCFSIQAASSLKQHESLRPCKRCGSPAKHSTEAQRAMCTRLSCLFDFCTRCQEAFHGSTPCRAVQPRSHFPTSKSTPHVPGSARSKRNIRRLWPLGFYSGCF